MNVKMKNALNAVNLVEAKGLMNTELIAHQELCDIYKQDFSFDALKWQSVAKEKSGIVANPLSEKFR